MIEKAEIIKTRPGMGKTRDYVRCSCGHVSAFYRWSWAGNGVAKCKGCGAKIRYINLEILPVKEADHE